MNDGELDDLIRKAGLAEPVDSSRVEMAIRARLRPRRWPWFAGTGAMAAGLAFLAIWPSQPPREYRDAARDHRLEVVEHRPRHWKSDPAELRTVENTVHVPLGYRLKEFKRCGINGKPTLHLVYSNGSRDVSVYVAPELRAARGSDGPPASVDGQAVAAFRGGLVVGSAADCRQFADVIQRFL